MLSRPAAEAPVAQGADAPVFFMHIAKTAGSYLNTVLVDAYGAGRVATFSEEWLGNTDDLRRRLAGGARVISGHIMNALWEEIVAPLDTRFTKITVLREPHEHLASHLHWLDHYNRPDMRGEYALLDEAHRRVIDRIGAVNLTDPAQLDEYMTHLGPSEIALFDNCQSRYLIGNDRRGLRNMQPLTLSDAKAIRAALAGFDVVLRQDRLPEDIPRLSERLGLSLPVPQTRVNAGRSTRRIDTSSPLIRQILSKRTIVDQWLWREVTA